MIDWPALGFQLVASFDDGQETINYLKKHPVDAVLTDIKMTVMSGLDVAEFIYENMPCVKVVIISGYRDFDYAKKAVDYNVERYLLKPMQFSEIDTAFREIKLELDKEREKEEETNRFKERYQEMLPGLQEHFFINLLMGALRDEKEIKYKIGLLELNIDPYKNKCAIIDMSTDAYMQYLDSQWAYGKEKLDIAITNFIGIERENIRYFPLFHNNNELKVIAVSSAYIEMQRMKEKIEQHLQSMMKTTREILGLSISLTVEQLFFNVFELSGYHRSIILQQYIETRGQEVELHPKEYERLINMYKLFMSNIHDGDTAAVMGLVDTYMDEISQLPVKYIHKLVIDLFVILTNKFMELGTDIWRYTNGRADYHKIVSMQQLDAIREWMQKAFQDIMSSTKKYQLSSSDHIIESAKQFIDEKYDKDISLESVADHVFLNAAYFSRIFKQRLGENFTDYLTRIRMEKAISLLKQKRYKSYEIGERVGYNNSKYFSRVFKQYTGYTTKEYARIVLNADGGSL